MAILTKKYFDEYLSHGGKDIPLLIAGFDFSKKADDFIYLTKAAAVYSSNIEGNPVDLNSFMNYELNKNKFKPTKEIEEIDNLAQAYVFAQDTKLTEKHFLEAHAILSKTLLIESKRGKYREEPVGVFGKNGLVYLAVEPEHLEKIMKDFFEEVTNLLSKDLTIEEIFYFASLMHLRFAHIHPFMDGNGRVARLLEKWFLSEKAGKDFWEISSERFYKENQKRYYKTINLGINFYELNYDNCIDFLLLLPESLKHEK